MPERRIAAMVTIDRPGQYVHRAVKSLFDTGFLYRYPKLHLVCGSPEVEYLGQYRGNPKIEIHEMGFEGVELWKTMYPLAKCGLGHWRMLKVIGRHEWDEALLLEDDIVFSGGWHRYLEYILPQIKEKHGDGWMLALYQHEKCRAEYEKGNRWYRLGRYCGGLAEVHTRKSVEGMAEFLWDNTVKKYSGPSDQLMGRHCQEHGLAVLATAPSLVDHIGEVSVSKISGFYHRADVWQEVVCHSQVHEELFLEDFFKENPPEHKNFCDVGAFDGITNSNTYGLFEQGWKGIAIEPHPDSFGKLQRLYSGTGVFVVEGAVAGHEDGLKLFFPKVDGDDHRQYATCVEEEKNRWSYKAWKSCEVKTFTLAKLFKTAPGPIDFLSVDCEGMDLEVLKSADFAAVKPRLIMAEHHGNVDAIDQYLVAFGYERVYMNSINAAWAKK